MQYLNNSAVSFHRDLLECNTTYNAIEREYISKTPAGKLYSDLCSVDEMIAGGLNWCADKLDNLLLAEASYIPAENYSPVVKQTQMSGKQVRLEPKIPGSFFAVVGMAYKILAIPHTPSLCGFHQRPKLKPLYFINYNKAVAVLDYNASPVGQKTQPGRS